jgi:DNA-binding transcriptional LysR family regulator
VPLAEAVENAVVAVQARVKAHASLVRLAVPSGFPRLFTAKLAMLRREHPELSLELVSGARPVDLDKGEADLAIRIGPIADPELVARKVGDVGWSVYASKAYLKGRPRVDLDDLRGHDVIGFDASLAGSPAARWLDARAGQARVAVRSREMTDMLAAAVNGAGIAVLPCVLGDAEPLLRRLTAEVVASRPAALIHRREAVLAEAVLAVKRFVIVVMHDASRALAGR